MRGNHIKSIRRFVLPALLAGIFAVQSGCSVAGAIGGGLLGAALGGPEGAVIFGEMGFYLGAGIDAAIIEAAVEGPPPSQCEGDHAY